MSQGKSSISLSMAKIKILAALSLAVFLTACGGNREDVIYRPSGHLLPAHIKKIALKPVENKTQQFALEDKLTLKINNRFITDGTYQIAQVSEADGTLTTTISRYIHLPVAYDSNLIATQYKLDVIVNLTFVDRTSNTILWQEPNLVGTIVYPASTLPGGMTEEQAREIVWERLAKDIMDRTIKGFGSVTGESKRKISNQDSPQPVKQP